MGHDLPLPLRDTNLSYLSSIEADWTMYYYPPIMRKALQFNGLGGKKA